LKPIPDQPAARFVVPADHPALPGHFPGHPIVPGVLLLDAVLQAASVSRAQLLRAKFTAPVLPGDPVEITITQRGPARLAFTCCCRGITVLAGELTCRPPDPHP
jgi:3-hydroxymyristoyl/3-hydroxydecanoyl-(acyl carrier protein) dehydratase